LPAAAPKRASGCTQSIAAKVNAVPAYVNTLFGNQPPAPADAQNAAGTTKKAPETHVLRARARLPSTSPTCPPRSTWTASPAKAEQITGTATSDVNIVTFAGSGRSRSATKEVRAAETNLAGAVAVNDAEQQRRHQSPPSAFTGVKNATFRSAQGRT
jgi:hypothetical protein